MIQRIQSIWMLIAVVLLIIFACTSYVSVLTPLADININPFGQSLSASIGETGNLNLVDFSWVPGVVSVIATLVTAIAIFLFKNRILQARLIVFAIILLLILNCILGYVLYQVYDFAGSTSGIMLGASVKLHIHLLWPLISIVFLYLAVRRVYYDEALIRASNRIR